MNKILSLLLTVLFCIHLPVSADGTRYTDFVDPFIGTGSHGHTFPGATLPFGMVQVSPDTRLTGWDGCSAYHYSDNIVYGFSHTHLSGTGCSDYGDILLMPTTGPLQLEKGDGKNTESGYHSAFRHEDETAAPGYYSVILMDYDIKAELTATKRAAFHRYTFPKTNRANIIIDLEHRDKVIEGHIKIVNEREIAGLRRSTGWAADQYVYFIAKFSKPFDSCGLAIDDEIKKDLQRASGENVKAYVTFDTEADEAILVKIGISAVSIKGARKNVDAEIPGWDFDKIREDADQEWNTALSKIHIEGGTKEQRTTFYTSLYHTLLAPNLYVDVDGRYRGRDLLVHQINGWDYYTVFSLWDTYRATHPLFTIIEPERTVDFIKTFITQYEEGGRLPVWELAANETECMIGYHAVSVIADAYTKGIRDFDAEKAFEAMKHSAVLDHFGLKYYKALGYIPMNKEGDSVSRTLEYAYDDWCIARMAKELKKEEDYERYIRRAQYYKNIFDPSTGFMRAKFNGGWASPFDPAEVNFNYTEANSWQYSFYVPQDLSGLIEMMGGKDRFTEKLDALFTADSKTTGREQADITGLIGQYAHGNEPSHHMAYLYNYANQPWKTQQRVRQILDELYQPRPDGLCGNEDCGQMSAWYVLSAMGFYPVTPGLEVYAIGTPLFDKAVIDVGKNTHFIVKANHVSGDNIYIQSATLDGIPYQESYLNHYEIVIGGELIFEMGPRPNTKWGSEDKHIPSTSITDNLLLPVPFVASGERVFTQSTKVSLASVVDDAAIYYSMDGNAPTLDSDIYSAPFELTESAVLKAFAYKEGLNPSAVITAEFSRLPENRSIELNTAYSSQYTAGGDMALIDLIRGSENFRTGTWQGYHGVDIDAVVDLGSIKRIQRISTGFLQDQDSWIFMPSEVEYAVSKDGDVFDVIATLENDIPETEEGGIIKEFFIEDINMDVRYVRVRAKNIGVCPEWHKGAGGTAWIFADEIVVE